jgi:hypothetical protein
LRDEIIMSDVENGDSDPPKKEDGEEGEEVTDLSNR